MGKEKSISLHQVRNAPKQIKRPIENNLYRNAEAVSVSLFCKKSSSLKFHNIHKKAPVPEPLFDKVACIKPAVYLQFI